MGRRGGRRPVRPGVAGSGLREAAPRGSRALGGVAMAVLGATAALGAGAVAGADAAGRGRWAGRHFSQIGNRNHRRAAGRLPSDNGGRRLGHCVTLKHRDQRLSGRRPCETLHLAPLAQQHESRRRGDVKLLSQRSVRRDVDVPHRIAAGLQRADDRRHGLAGAALRHREIQQHQVRLGGDRDGGQRRLQRDQHLQPSLVEASEACCRLVDVIFSLPPAR